MPEGLGQRASAKTESAIASVVVARENLTASPKRIVVYGYSPFGAWPDFTITEILGQQKSFNNGSSQPRRAGLPFNNRLASLDADNVLSDDQQLEEAYQYLGTKFGPDAGPQIQNKVLELFRSTGVAGAEWLIRRLRVESISEVFESASLLLGQLGSDGLTPLLRELEHEPNEDMAECLLTAVRFLSPVVGQSERRLSALLRVFSRHSDKDVRRSAYRATRSVSRSSAIEILQVAGATETDPRLKALIHDLLRVAQE